MRIQHRRPRHTPRLRIPLALPLALALAIPLAAAGPAPAAAPPRAAAAPEPVSEEAAAIAKAQRTGGPVEVLAQRTETSQVFANPEGTFTQDTYAVPQWVRKDRTLVPIDPDLQSAGNGTLVTKATEVGLTFSGGGEGPLATITRDGRSMSWSWPKPLPKPEVSGNTVTYPEVFKGVDLKLRAGTSGFSQLLVVKTAEAATNPELKSLDFKLGTEGVDVSADEHGNLKAVNPAGQVIFTAPTPRMWDSSDAATGPATLGRAAQSPPTDEFEPGHGAQEAAMPLAVAEDQMTLEPDQHILTGKDITYPVYIDPSVSGSREAWAIAYKKYPSATFYNGAGWINADGSKGTSAARIGYENQDGGTGRSFFRMDSNNLWNTDKVITKSVFQIRNSWSWSCTDRPAELWLTGSISSSTSWNNQPSWGRKLASVNESKGYNSSCPAGNLAFDVTSAANDSVTNKWNNITLGMRASNETDTYAWKKFDAKSAVLSTTYNTRPDKPTGLYTSPSSGSNCGVTTPYTTIGNTDVYLGAKVIDRDGGTVKARFVLWPTGHGGASNEVNQLVSVTSGTVAKLKTSKAALSKLLSDAKVPNGGTFTWSVRSEDGALNSAWTAQCHFGFDATRPSNPPGVTSVQFPNGDDGWPTNTGSVRSEGTFTFTSGGIADVARYEYWSDWDTTRRTAAPAAAGGSITVKLTPTVAGSNHLYVRSFDRANNPSDENTYLFYANGTKVPDKPGDINGDGNSDLWAIDKDGILHRFYGAGDGQVADASARASADTWTGAKITHRGDWTDDGYEDLIALRNDTALGTHRMWLHHNNGYGFACTNCTNVPTRQELTTFDPANNHWKSGAKQILAVGDVDGGTDTDGDGKLDIPGYPDLIVNDGKFLWLYYGAPDNRLDSVRDPVLLAGPDDPISEGVSTVGEITLAAPGDWNADGQADLVARYDRPDAGGLYVFHGREGDYGYDISLSDRALIGWNWSTATVPQFTAAPDANNNGKFDLWATTPNSGELRFFADFTSALHTTLTTASNAFANYQTIS
ncbi:VCBS repeat-containing protein [Streptomyces candidus]|uniref:VCBS repeat-containing protein n=1 Tax=Streptomyces candidus TaxID=67283 RepID=A0A7X0HLQ7_9ACTN|nr:VCBS repeat-containing protein [Streptomyces candidus]MBB6439871.1 hypothetical protein [Streptomyces candidus]GHH55844.1 hypothetical protein GCM10018773_60820 [Streptomyces candidus]